MPRARTDGRPMSMWMSDAMIARLDVQAERRGVSRSEWARRALDRVLVAEEGKPAVARWDGDDDARP